MGRGSGEKGGHGEGGVLDWVEVEGGGGWGCLKSAGMGAESFDGEVSLDLVSACTCPLITLEFVFLSLPSPRP